MRHKRLPVAALSFLLCFFLIACGGNNSGNNFTGNSGNNNGNTGGNTGGSTGDNGGGQTGGTNTSGNSGSGTAASDTVAGRILDAGTGAAINGDVVVALEKPSDGSIVNETAPDAQGNFSFTQVAGGDYALVIAAQSSSKAAYTPQILVSSGSTFGAGKTISPGVNVGTMKIALAPGTSTGTLNVHVNSDKPITVTLSAAINYSGHSFQYPWPDSAPTFDTSVQTSCNGGACANSTVQLPSAPARVAVYNGDSTQYSANGTNASMDLFANAYMQTGVQPSCTSSTLGPNSGSIQDDKTTDLAPFDFTGCQ